MTGDDLPGIELRIRRALLHLRDDPAITTPIDPGRWFGQYQAAEARVRELPTALNHGELAPQQLGRTAAAAGGRLVPLDLETMALLPRWTDVAAVVHDLSRHSGRTQQDLLGVYLREDERLTGERIEPDVAWTEVVRTKVVTGVQALPWLMSMRAHLLVGPTVPDAVAVLAGDLTELDTAD